MKCICWKSSVYCGNQFMSVKYWMNFEMPGQKYSTIEDLCGQNETAHSYEIEQDRRHDI